MEPFFGARQGSVCVCHLYGVISVCASDKSKVSGVLLACLFWSRIWQEQNSTDFKKSCLGSDQMRKVKKIKSKVVDKSMTKVKFFI
jgi:hypothetical protein